MTFPMNMDSRPWLMCRLIILQSQMHCHQQVLFVFFNCWVTCSLVRGPQNSTLRWLYLNLCIQLHSFDFLEYNVGSCGPGLCCDFTVREKPPGLSETTIWEPFRSSAIVYVERTMHLIWSSKKKKEEAYMCTKRNGTSQADAVSWTFPAG